MGLFDEVMESINAKEGQAPPSAGTEAPARPEAAQSAPAETNTSLHRYCDDFNAKYGGRKK